MKLYIKQEVFSFGDRFYIKNEAGQDVYSVEGEVFTLGKKLHIYDMAGQEVAFIKQELFSFPTTFQVYVDGTLVVEIMKEITFFKPKYVIEGMNWVIQGEFFAHDYDILQDGVKVASISKEWMTWGDSYELDIADSRDEIVALAVVLTIDCVTEDQARSSSN